MQFRFTVALAITVLVVSVSRRAEALDEHIRVKPSDGHVSVTIEKTDKGHVRFTITRDPAKNPDKSRQGWLTVSSDAGFIAECAMAAKTSEEQVAYHFDLASGAVKHSHFMLREYRPSKDGEPLQLGGATVFEIRLADFVREAIGPDALPRGVGKSKSGPQPTRPELADGVYPVVPKEDAQATASNRTVTLIVVPVEDSKATEPEMIQVTTEPLVRFHGEAVKKSKCYRKLLWF